MLWCESERQLLPALDPNEMKRRKALAFADKKSLVQAATWAEQAKSTSKDMEDTRQAIKRSARKILKK